MSANEGVSDDIEVEITCRHDETNEVGGVGEPKTLITSDHYCMSLSQ